MTYALLTLVALLGYLAYRTIGWCRIETPIAEQWHALLDAKDEPAMPPRTNRRIYP